jgi:hypothetical protein
MDLLRCVVRQLLSTDCGELEEEKVSLMPFTRSSVFVIPFYFSVLGLNFDFLSLNIVGFFMYSIFNIALLYIKPIEVGGDLFRSGGFF